MNEPVPAPEFTGRTFRFKKAQNPKTKEPQLAVRIWGRPVHLIIVDKEILPGKDPGFYRIDEALVGYKSADGRFRLIIAKAVTPATEAEIAKARNERKERQVHRGSSQAV